MFKNAYYNSITKLHNYNSVESEAILQSEAPKIRFLKILVANVVFPFKYH